MASFFKRFVTSALDRREERRDINILQQEKEIEFQLKRLQEAEKSRRNDVKVLKERKKIIAPLQIRMGNALGINPDDIPVPFVATALKQVDNDPNQAVKLAERLGPEAVLQVQADVVEAPETMVGVPSMTERQYGPRARKRHWEASSTMTAVPSMTDPLLPSGQRAREAGRQTEELLRRGEPQLSTGKRFASTVLGSLLGEAPGSTREKIRSRYSSLFDTDEEGAEAYNATINYIQKLSKEGSITAIPPINPEVAAEASRLAQFVRGRDKFEEKLDLQLNRQLKPDFENMKTTALAGIPPSALGNITPENFRAAITGVSALSLQSGRSNANARAKYKAQKEYVKKYFDYRRAIEVRARQLFDEGLTSGADAASIVRVAKEQIDNKYDKRGKPVQTPDGESVDTPDYVEDLRQANQNVMSAVAQEKVTADTTSTPAESMEQKNLMKALTESHGVSEEEVVDLLTAGKELAGVSKMDRSIRGVPLYRLDGSPPLYFIFQPKRGEAKEVIKEIPANEVSG